MSENWREILDKVARGELTAEQGAVLMGGGKLEAETAPGRPHLNLPPNLSPSLSRAPSGPSFARASTAAGASPEPDSDPELSSRLEYWKRWWLIPLWIGLGIFIAGAGLIAWGYTSQRTFWFVCGFLPLLFGLLGYRCILVEPDRALGARARPQPERWHDQSRHSQHAAAHPVGGLGLAHLRRPHPRFERA